MSASQARDRSSLCRGRLSLLRRGFASPGLHGALRHTRPLFLPHLFERQPCAVRDHLEHRMSGISRQSQGMYLLPCANANVGRIGGRGLLGKRESPLLQAFLRFDGHTFGVSSDELSGGTRC